MRKPGGQNQTRAYFAPAGAKIDATSPTWLMVGEREDTNLLSEIMARTGIVWVLRIFKTDPCTGKGDWPRSNGSPTDSGAAMCLKGLTQPRKEMKWLYRRYDMERLFVFWTYLCHVVVGASSLASLYWETWLAQIQRRWDVQDKNLQTALWSSLPNLHPPLLLRSPWRRLPLFCRCTACFQLPKECRPNCPAVFKKKPELCLCQSQERLISSIFCSSAGGKSSTILVMAQWTGIASCACVIEIRCLELHNYFGHDLA